MKILALGDPHGVVPKKIPKNIDLILITGDLGKADLARQRTFKNQERERNGLSEIEDDKNFVKRVHDEIHFSVIKVLKFLGKYAPIYTIQGNVGISTLSEVKEINEKWKLNLSSTKKEIDKIKKIHLVKNQLRIINGIRIGFLEFFTDTSWIREFKPNNYRKKMKSAKKQTEKAKRILKKFDKIDILVCRQPPFEILDKVNFKGIPKNWKDKHAGSKAILDYIKTHQPKLVLCGHIHEAKGKAKIGKTIVHNLGCCGDYKILEI